LHDIGKIGVPGYILNKAGTLTYEEFKRDHEDAQFAGRQYRQGCPVPSEFIQTDPVSSTRIFDGSGYPEGLKGEQIPIGARIIHVADAFEVP